MINTQEFDVCDCPYVINTFIEENNIKKDQIISFSRYRYTVAMFYYSE
ncbi:hypothetical protein [Maribacter dokdonensis]|nr:hypothetical protein [Maribacter dokdonensis]